jgi:Protein of unknown function (DUF1064)
MRAKSWTSSDVAEHFKRLEFPDEVVRPFMLARGLFGTAGRQKYGATPTVVDGITFRSKREAEVYKLLLTAQQAGYIGEIVLQPRYLLQDAFRDHLGRWHRAIVYVADFETTRVGQRVVIEVKGFATAIWKLKEKLFRAKYPDLILEVWK